MVRWLVWDGVGALGVNLVLWAWIALVPIMVLRVRRVPFGALGMALPGLILVRGDMGDSVIRHELVHQDQMRRWSPLGAAVLLGLYYGRGFLRHRLLDQSTFMQLYAQNPLELEANRLMFEDSPLPRPWSGRGGPLRKGAGGMDAICTHPRTYA